jgi:hypothetical protein
MAWRLAITDKPYKPPYAFSVQIGETCARKMRTFHDLADRLGMDVTDLMRQCNGKVPPRQILEPYYFARRPRHIITAPNVFSNRFPSKHAARCEIAQALGHESIKTTEKHYAACTGTTGSPGYPDSWFLENHRLNLPKTRLFSHAFPGVIADRRHPPAMLSKRRHN